MIEIGQKFILTKTFWPISVTIFPPTYLPTGLWLHFFDRIVRQNSVFLTEIFGQNVGQIIFWPIVGQNFGQILILTNCQSVKILVTIKFRRIFFRPTEIGQNFNQNVQIRSKYEVFSVKDSVKMSVRFCSDCNPYVTVFPKTGYTTSKIPLNLDTLNPHWWQRERKKTPYLQCFSKADVRYNISPICQWRKLNFCTHFGRFSL